MRRHYTVALWIVMSLIVSIANQAFAADLDNMSTDDMITYIRQLESENNDLKAQLGAAGTNLSLSESQSGTVASTDVQAADEKDVEFKKPESGESELKVNTLYQDSLSSGEDENWYLFNLSAPGYIYLTFGHDLIEDDSAFWRTTFCFSDKTEITWVDHTGRTTEDSSMKIGLPAGSYYMKVIPGYRYSEKNYTFSIHYSAASDWELEFNNEITQANIIPVNQEIHGTLHNGEDADWYQFSREKEGFIKLHFLHDYIEDGDSYWFITLYNQDKQELTSYDIPGNKVDSWTGSVGLPAGTGYIKVITHRDYSGADYSIMVQDTPSEEWEKEFNDSYDTATPYTLGNYMNGSICRTNDKDWYKVNIEQSGLLILSFHNEYIENGANYWRAVIFDPTMNEMASYHFSGDAVDTSTEPIEFPAGDCYIKVECSSDYSNADYSFSLHG